MDTDVRRGAVARSAALVVLLSTLALPSSAIGNGGTLRLARVPAGPFLVSAWTRPDPPRVGRLDISVAVMSPESGEALLDAEVRLGAARAGNPHAIFTTVGTRGGGGNPVLYHGELELPAAERWQVAISVRSPAGAGAAAFEVTAIHSQSVLRRLVAVLIAGLLFWLAWRRPRARTTSGEEPPSGNR